MVAIDAAHHNFHTADGRYAPFATVLRNDGFRVVSLDETITRASLAPVQVLVIANALDASNVKSWKLPTPSAFTDEEVETLRQWVSEGGSVLVIADHMPFAGAIQKLAAAFGFAFDNDYAAKGDGSAPEVFSRSAGTLPENEITRGTRGGAGVTEVQTFIGSSFRAPAGAIPLMLMDDGWTLFEPSAAGKFNETTPRRAATSQDLRGAALAFGEGRVVVISEAAFLTNQIVNGAPYGFGLPTAAQDKQFLLNVVEWLGRAP
ncbi:DUF4350 domain-containing protein [Phenylobacterium sp.]|uniref:DUF4350 domain-containing protein n=1 Tax=Phenylobacterium sp. TaxID=1871053 RepID=UPI0035B38602